MHVNSVQCTVCIYKKDSQEACVVADGSGVGDVLVQSRKLI